MPRRKGRKKLSGSCRSTDASEPAAELEEQPWMHSWRQGSWTSPRRGTQPPPPLLVPREGSPVPGLGQGCSLGSCFPCRRKVIQQAELPMAGCGIMRWGCSSAFAPCSSGHSPVPAQLGSGCRSWQHCPAKGFYSPLGLQKASTLLQGHFALLH